MSDMGAPVGESDGRRGESDGDGVESADDRVDVESTVTIGVIIHVPEPLAGRIEQVRSAAGEELFDVPAHVTLVPPTPIPAASTEAFVEHLGGVAASARPFDVRLKGTDTFQPVTDVVFLRVVAGHDDCDALQQQLRAGPEPIELRYPYHPHVTAAHDVPQGALDEARASLAEVDETFTVDRFVLYVDGSAGDWERAQAFALSGA